MAEVHVNKLGEHAAVLGAGIAGLLTARVLSDFYRTVTVVERDPLPDSPVQRKGIPQGRHLNGMLSRGSQVLEELFPGFLDEFVAAGANVVDDGDLSRIYSRIGSYGVNRSGKFKDPAALVIYPASRPFLEFHVRRRVAALGNVRFLDRCDVVEPVASADRVTGVRVVNRDNGIGTTLATDLVVDATGRAARTPAFLENLGYGRASELRCTTHATYSSQLLRIPDGAVAEKLMMVIQPGKGKPRCALALTAYEHGTWMLTVGRSAIDTEPPTSFPAMLALAEQFTPPPILAGLRSATPIGDVSLFRYTGAVWRRYDHMPRFPEGLLVIGDALCSLNPIYGQGMTMAALEALALQDHLRRADARPQEFFRAAATQIGPTWAMNQARDEAPSTSRRRRSLSGRLMFWTVGKALKAAENDIVLTEALHRVTSMVDPPSRLRDPSLIPRVIVGNVRRMTRAQS